MSWQLTKQLSCILFFVRLLTSTQFFWLSSLSVTYSLSLCSYSVFVWGGEVKLCMRNLPMARSWRNETRQHSCLSVKVPLGVLEGLAASVPTPSSSGWPPWLSFLLVHGFYAQGFLFLKMKHVFPSVHVFFNSQIKFKPLNKRLYILWLRTIFS